MFYDGYKFNKHASNVTGTIRWRCEACQRVTITTKESTIVNLNDGSHSMLCKKMVPVESECAELKNLTRGYVNNFKIISYLDIIILIIFVTAEEFEFKKSYAQSIKDLHK
jgi:hypothetical protein